MSFNIHEATQMVLALVRALNRNVSMETLMHTYLIRSPVEKERFRVEAEHILGKYQLAAWKFEKHLRFNTLTEASLPALKQLLRELQDHNSYLLQFVFELRRNQVYRDMHRRTGAPIPSCPVQVMYRDFPDLLPRQQTGSQPLTVLCDFILDRYKLSNDPMINEVLSKINREDLVSTQAVSSSGHCEPSVGAPGYQAPSSATAGPSGQIIKPVEPKMAPAGRAVTVPTQPMMVNHTTANTLSGHAVTVPTQPRMVNHTTAKTQSGHAVTVPTQPRMVNHTTAKTQSGHAVTVPTQPTMVNKTQSGHAVTVPTQPTMVNKTQSGHAVTVPTQPTMVNKTLSGHAVTVPTQSRMVKPQTAKAGPRDLSFLFTEPVNLKTGTPVVQKSSLASDTTHPQTVREVCQQPMTFDPSKVNRKVTTTLSQGHMSLRKELEVKRQRMLAKLQTQPNSTKASTGNKRPANTSLSARPSVQSTSSREAVCKRRAETSACPSVQSTSTRVVGCKRRAETSVRPSDQQTKRPKTMAVAKQGVRGDNSTSQEKKSGLKVKLTRTSTSWSVKSGLKSRETHGRCN